MATTKDKKTFIRLEVSRAVRRLRDKLGKISQAKLAEMVGPEVSPITISRWERGSLMPYPKNRQKLATLAMDHHWWDIAAALDVKMSFDEWLALLEMTAPSDYRVMMTVSMCALYGYMFQPEDPENPTEGEIEVARKSAMLAKLGDELLSRLAEIHNAGLELIAPPPNDHYRRFWFDILDRVERRATNKPAAARKGAERTGRDGQR